MAFCCPPANHETTCRGRLGGSGCGHRMQSVALAHVDLAVDVVNPVAQRTRRVLLIACLLTVPAVAWRGADIAAAVARDRVAAAAYQRGVVLQNDGRYDEAAAAFRQAIATSPSAITAYADLGDVELSR